MHTFAQVRQNVIDEAIEAATAAGVETTEEQLAAIYDEMVEQEREAA